MNVILIGFKASGKTTLGKALARLLNRPFIDTDRLLEQRYQEKTGTRQSFRQIFSLLGDEGFRALESEVLANLSDKKEAVIATGGGMAARQENISLLKQNGQVVLIDTPFPTIQKRLSGTSSPLFSGSSVNELYQRRRPAYLQAADLIFTPEEQEMPEKLAGALKNLLGHQSPHEGNLQNIESEKLCVA